MNQYFWFSKVVEEINLLKKFSNPHIIRFIEAFENPGQVIHICIMYEGCTGHRFIALGRGMLRGRFRK